MQTQTISNNSVSSKSAWLLRQAATQTESADRLRRQQAPITEQLNRFPDSQDLRDAWASLERRIRIHDAEARRYLSHVKA